MSIRRLITFPDRSLSRPCDPIRRFDDALEILIRDLWDTLYHSPGVGLAAPQIGIPSRVAVIDISKRDKKAKPFVMVNPRLLNGSGLQIPREGCLSVPELLANVRRYQKVTVQFKDEQGQAQRKTSEGFEALAIQHEIDHVDGKLFLDRVANLKTDLFRRKIS